MTVRPPPGRGPAPQRAPRRRLLGAGARALLLRRLALPDPAAGGGPPAGRRRGAGHARDRAGDRHRADHARRRHLDRGQRGRPGHRGRHQPLAQPGGGDRRATARTARVQPGVVHAALQREARRPRPALRTGPVHPHPLHDRRDARQQRLRLAGPGLRPVRRQRGRAPGRARRRHRARPPGCRARGTGRAGRRPPLHRAHRVRPVRAPGVGLLLRAPAAGERAPARPVPGRLRGHPRGGARGRGHARRGRAGPSARGARLPVDGRRGRRRTRAAGPSARRLRGARPPDRRRGAHPRRPRARPAAGRRAGCSRR